MAGIQRKWFKRKDQTISYSSCVVCSGYRRLGAVLLLFAITVSCAVALSLAARFELPFHVQKTFSYHACPDDRN